MKLLLIIPLFLLQSCGGFGLKVEATTPYGKFDWTAPEIEPTK